MVAAPAETERSQSGNAMKQRLTEMQDFRDPDEAEAARLLRSLSLPLQRIGGKRRVYARNLRRTPRAARAWLRVAVLVTALLVKQPPS